MSIRGLKRRTNHFIFHIHKMLRIIKFKKVLFSIQNGGRIRSSNGRKRKSQTLIVWAF